MLEIVLNLIGGGKCPHASPALSQRGFALLICGVRDDESCRITQFSRVKRVKCKFEAIMPQDSSSVCCEWSNTTSQLSTKSPASCNPLISRYQREFGEKHAAYCPPGSHHCGLRRRKIGSSSRRAHQSGTILSRTMQRAPYVQRYRLQYKNLCVFSLTQCPARRCRDLRRTSQNARRPIKQAPVPLRNPVSIIMR